MANSNPSFANPGPAGLSAFGLTTVLLSLINAGLLPGGGESVVIPLAIIFGGVNQIIAGVLEWRVGNTFGQTAFMSYGAFWIWFALLFLWGHNGMLDLSAAGPTLGTALILWGFISIGFWLPTFRTNLVLWLVMLGVVLVFFLLGLGAVMAMPALHTLGGYVGIVTGALAAYLGAAQLGAAHGSPLPVGGPIIKG